MARKKTEEADEAADFGKDIVFLLHETYEDETTTTGVYKSGEAMIEGLAESAAAIFLASRRFDSKEPSAEEKELARTVALAVYDFMRRPGMPESRADECRVGDTVFGFETVEVVSSSRDKQADTP